MLRLCKLGLTGLLLSSIACVPAFFKLETIPSDLGSGMTYTVGGVDFSGRVTVEFEPMIGGFSFGTSGQISVLPSSQAVLSFSSYGLDHYVYPYLPAGATWGTWVNSPVGSGDIGAFSL